MSYYWSHATGRLFLAACYRPPTFDRLRLAALYSWPPNTGCLVSARRPTSSTHSCRTSRDPRRTCVKPAHANGGTPTLEDPRLSLRGLVRMACLFANRGKPPRELSKRLRREEAALGELSKRPLLDNRRDDAQCVARWRSTGRSPAHTNPSGALVHVEPRPQLLHHRLLRMGAFRMSINYCARHGPGHAPSCSRVRNSMLSRFPGTRRTILAILRIVKCWTPGAWSNTIKITFWGWFSTTRTDA